MRPVQLTLSATSSSDLFAQLRAIDITVPLVTEGRKKEHRERYMMARFLATITKTEKVTFPLNLEHREKPDFVLRFGGNEIGIECIEAVPKELYEIEILRERHYPDALNFGQKFHPDTPSFTWEEKHQIASGQLAGPPWMSGSAKRNWIVAMEHFIRKKTEKLHQGNYASNSTTWLLIQDEWPAPLQFYPEQLREAAAECAHNLSTFITGPCFQLIWIASGNQLLCIKGSQLQEVEGIYDLWSNDYEME